MFFLFLQPQGRLLLGTWQAILYIELDGGKQRNLIVQTATPRAKAVAILLARETAVVTKNCRFPPHSLWVGRMSPVIINREKQFIDKYNGIIPKLSEGKKSENTHFKNS